MLVLQGAPISPDKHTAFGHLHKLIQLLKLVTLTGRLMGARQDLRLHLAGSLAGPVAPEGGSYSAGWGGNKCRVAAIAGILIPPRRVLGNFKKMDARRLLSLLPTLV